jgi:hypothetical protein
MAGVYAEKNKHLTIKWCVFSPTFTPAHRA